MATAAAAWCLILATLCGPVFTTPRVVIDAARRRATFTNPKPHVSFPSTSGALTAAVPLAAFAIAFTTRRRSYSSRQARDERHSTMLDSSCQVALKQASASGRRAILARLGLDFSQVIATAAVVAGGAAPCLAQDKQRNLPPEQIAAIIEKDVSERAFMVSADLTRSVYDEKCTFTDEIDTYEIDKFIKGTKALFMGPPYSKLSLTSPVTATDTDLKFTFSEDLVFNIPFKPVMSLTGRMEMKRGPDGLITSYREFWDGGVPKVLSTVRLSGY